VTRHRRIHQLIVDLAQRGQQLIQPRLPVGHADLDAERASVGAERDADRRRGQGRVGRHGHGE
jgi:hypothetical protein